MRYTRILNSGRKITKFVEDLDKKLSRCINYKQIDRELREEMEYEGIDLLTTDYKYTHIIRKMYARHNKRVSKDVTKVLLDFIKLAKSKGYTHKEIVGFVGLKDTTLVNHITYGLPIHRNRLEKPILYFKEFDDVDKGDPIMSMETIRSNLAKRGLM